MKRNRGMTLITLVVTIIIMLILVGVALTFALGDNDIINKSKSAKIHSDVAQEKELLVQSAATAKGKSEYGNVEKNYLDFELNRRVGQENYTSKTIKKGIEVTFVSSGRTYLVETDGDVNTREPVVIPEGLQIGSKVTYEPEGNTYNWRAEYASSDLETDGSQDVILDSRIDGAYRITKWKVFKIDEDEGIVQLVSENRPTAKVRLQGAQGYNNAVQLLDAACDTLYSDDKNAITARNVDADDINSLLKEEKLQEIKADGEKPNIYSYQRAYSHFPRIYEEEVKSVINGIENTKGIGLSEPGSKLYTRTEATSLIDQTMNSNATNGYLQAKTNIKPYQTMLLYRFNNTDCFADEANKDKYFSMLYTKDAWLATRCVSYSNLYCDYIVKILSYASSSDQMMFSSGQYLSNPMELGASKELFPIVSVDSNLIKRDGDNFKVDI